MPTQISGDTGVSQVQAGAVQAGDIAAGAVSLTELSQKMTLSALVPFTSFTTGYYHDFDNIPSWVKRVTILFLQLSTTGSSFIRVQTGTGGGLDSLGYASTNGTIGSTSVSGSTGSGQGWDIIVSTNATTISGRATINLIGNSTYVFDSLTSCIASVNTCITAGHRSASSGPIDRIRITTANGSDTFDGGSISILYEG